ncbi:MAG: ABC transporter permease [Myxococcaceae bacterium]|nr:MAG: ABC transporter permease [Myxococcaceae bacterium]
MAVDLIILWIVSRAVASQARRRWLYAAWMVGAVALSFLCLKLAARMEPRGFDPTPSLALVALRVGVLVSALEAYFLSTLLWMPKLFDRLEKVAAELTIAVRQLRARKSGFLTVISFLAFLGVGLGSFALCMTISIMGGFGNDLKHKILGNNPHVVVDRERGGFTDWQPLLRSIRALPEVSAATPLVQGEVMITSQTNLSGVILRGIDPAQGGAAIGLRRELIRGRIEYLEDPARLDHLSPSDRRPVVGRGELELPTTRLDGLSGFSDTGSLRPPPPGAPTEPLPGIVVGRELATNLHLAVGDEVRVVSPFGSIGPLGPMPKTKLFRVAGIFYSGMYEYDTKYAYVLIPVAQRFFNYRDGAITAIEVRLRDVDLSDQVVAAVEAPAHARSLRVRDWKQLNQNLFRALKLEKLLIWLLLTVAIIVASFSIVATLLLLVTEKGREIAVLKAMGASDGFITRVFLSVGGLIGVVGALLGTSAAVLSAMVMKHVGIPLDPEVYYIDRLPVLIAPADYSLVFVTSVGICLLAATFPAVLAGRLRPVEGLRFS